MGRTRAEAEQEEQATDAKLGRASRRWHELFRKARDNEIDIDWLLDELKELLDEKSRGRMAERRLLKMRQASLDCQPADDQDLVTYTAMYELLRLYPIELHESAPAHARALTLNSAREILQSFLERYPASHALLVAGHRKRSEALFLTAQGQETVAREASAYVKSYKLTRTAAGADIVKHALVTSSVKRAFQLVDYYFREEDIMRESLERRAGPVSTD